MTTTITDNATTAFNAFIQEYSNRRDENEAIKYATDWLDTERDASGFMAICAAWMKGAVKAFYNKLNEDGSFSKVQLIYSV